MVISGPSRQIEAYAMLGLFKAFSEPQTLHTTSIYTGQFPKEGVVESSDTCTITLFVVGFCTLNEEFPVCMKCR